MKHLKRLIVAFLVLGVRCSHCLLTCPKADIKCECYPGSEFEFQCPKTDSKHASGKFVMHIEEDKKILIDCFNFTEDYFPIDQLPNVTVGSINTFHTRFCPLPKNSFRNMFDQLHITRVEELKFQSCLLSENSTLKGSYFKDLDTLTTLNLNNNELVHLEEDIFINLPKLTTIELAENNLELKPNLFQHTPLLKWLDISRNKLKHIPDGLFRDLKNLQILHLWSNNLTSINETTFKGLSNLKSLELIANKIESISENAFRDLDKLTQINLSKNHLQHPPSNLFSKNKALKTIFMRNNPKLILPDYFFSNLSLLEQVHVNDCNLTNVPDHIFENSTQLKVLNFGKNRLQNISGAVFDGLENLEELWLNNNSIQEIISQFYALKKLKKLHLENNQITFIERNAFRYSTYLEGIYLQNNEITNIHFQTFYNNHGLKIINLSHNKIIANSTLFDNNPETEEIYLSHNLITLVEDVISVNTNKIKLKQLDLSYNRITEITLYLLQTISNTKLNILLNDNNITKVDFDFIDNLSHYKQYDAFSKVDQAYTAICLTNNPIYCDCYSYDLLRYIQGEVDPTVKVMYDINTENLTCAGPPPLEEFSVEKLLPSKVLCPLNEVIEYYDDCPEACACAWRRFDLTAVIDCSNKGLKSFPEINLPLPNRFIVQTEVHLENNNLQTGPSSNLSTYNNVTKLFLSHNKIKSISWLPPHIEILKLDNNQIQQLDYKILNLLNTSRLLTLDNNPWACECQAENFTNFLRQHPKQVDTRHIYCFNSTTRLIDLSRNDLCHEFPVAQVLVPILVFLLVISILTALFYRYQQEIKVWLFANNLCLWWVTEEDLDKDKQYDAFISYSHKDEEFVTQNLIPRLESGSQPFKLCLHFRDFVPGEFISKQVTDSVLNSRRTLVVLSPNFLESVWGKMEFRTAHSQAMLEKRTRVIILLYDDVDVENLDGELKAYLKTNTYIKWGERYFWDKLMYALPHSKRNVSTGNQKHANVMNCIDDKFKLVSTPVSENSPGTTPPVLSLEAGLLKKHPLTFVSSSEMDTPPAEAGSLLTTTC